MKFPEIVHNCPYRAGEKYEINYTYIPPYCPVKNPQKPLMNGYFWPDGDYKISYIAFVNGKKVAHLYYWYRDKTADNKAW
jgi:hypothetical protein